MKKEPIKVVVVDDHPVVLQGFEYMLQDIDGIAFTGKFADAGSVIGCLQCNTVEVVLLDINLPDLNGIEIGEKIFISPLTVESHRRNLLQKFKVTNVAALIHKATEMKYI